ncbi:hypothetical protein M0R45_004627 [Rubus argutus]|uniref:Uncharacterized protein n=1 Tax=Rubus argutus TaxID=59490 RepID=A0AAW1YK98_RUBAR
MLWKGQSPTREPDPTGLYYDTKERNGHGLMSKVVNGDGKEYMECGPLQIFRYISCPAYHSLPYSSNMKDDALLFFSTEMRESLRYHYQFKRISGG